ncbi:hypothetical protein ElyMa_004204100 [Elysia marginata]|uniref:Protein TsetseEP domain-containing protein n=1 Tax=Elysia marginata TaxID=1093978 RepID=A0AAV4GLR1_9GAST|nr:hypothetical protein ElyMa_004204100 [Elysia marginata]
MYWQTVSSTLFLLYFVCVQLFSSVTCQSVAQRCLNAQIRDNFQGADGDNNNNNNIINENNVLNNENNARNNNENQANLQRAEDVTIAAFASICRNYQTYINCFEGSLPLSNQPADRFLNLVFTRGNMEVAYQGLCTLDLEELQGVIRCVLSTPEVRQCYNNFNRGVNQVVQLIDQNVLPAVTLQQLACNVSVGRYRCETAVYNLCNSAAGRIMRDFFYAGVTDTCREDTGVTSRYTAKFGGTSQIVGSGLLVVFCFALASISSTQTSH